MYITGTNCNGEYIVVMDRHELNETINMLIKAQWRKGYQDAQENIELGLNPEE